MICYEKFLMEFFVDFCFVVGDVIFIMACFIVVKKMGMKVVYVEVGICFYDFSMFEEINCMVIDSIIDYFFIIFEVVNINF